MRVNKSMAEDGLGPRPNLRRPPRRTRLSRARMLVLEALENQPEPCTVAAIAAILHQHTNTVREHLDGLVQAGFARRERRAPQGPGRPSWIYECVEEQQASAGAAEYAGLASALAAQIARSSSDPQGDALEAGHAWGQGLAAQAAVDAVLRNDGDDGDDVPDQGGGDREGRARETVVELLAALEFSPEASADGSTVRLRRCPLLEAAYRNPEIVCAVHLGLVRGALAELGVAPEGTRLLPFAEKGACRLDFAAPGPDGAAGQQVWE